MMISNSPFFLKENRNPSPAVIPVLVTEKPVIPIVSAFDDNFAPVFSVFLESLISSSSSNIFYDIIILSDKISEKNKKIIQSQVFYKKNIVIRFFEMQGILNKEALVHENHFSKPTFFRLKIPSILLGYEKVLYIDPDTIILQDLKEIYYEDLDDTYAGVVRCLNTMEHRLAGLRVGIPYKGQTYYNYFINEVKLPIENLNNYFNAGFLILNLKKIREDNLENFFISLFYSKNYFLVDQDILNKVFNNNITFLSNKWNVIPLSTTRKVAPLPHPYDLDYKQAIEDPAVIHYAAPHNKPWWNENVPFGEIFWIYAGKSPYYGIFLLKYLKSSKNPIKLLKLLISNCITYGLKKNLYLFWHFIHLMRNKYPNTRNR